jgi:predicted O-linked N-acetylglucosamine transferase (SPINDLY family)
VSEAILHQGLAAHRMGDLAGAARAYAAVLKANPRHFQALYLLGFVHFQSGQYERAEQLMADAIRLDPKVADVHYNRGCALQALQRYEEALACFSQAIALKPDYAEAFTNRGAALLALRRHAEALANFDTVLARAPGDLEALSNRATVLFETWHYEKAAGDYARLATLAPDFPYALGNYFTARAYACDWRSRDADFTRLRAELAAGRPVLQPHASTLFCDRPEDQLQAARIWVAVRCPPAREPLWRGEIYTHEKIRVAYLSADFHTHATAHLIAELIESHDRARVESTGISFGPDDGGAMRARLARGFDHFIDIRGRSDAEAAAELRAREIDIAVDLKGFTQGARPGILALRPAPVQVNYLGYPGTMGAPYIDYIIADRIVLPPEQRAGFSESVAYLPDSYQCNDATRPIAPDVPTRGEAGLPDTGFVFASFNNLYKITPAIFAVWMRLLRAVPGSVLWLLDDNADARGHLHREAQAHGVPAARLVFAARLPPDEHLARHRLADLFLDTLPCTAHTTASDALWAGLPLVTILGTSFAGRVAASLLHAMGLPELIAGSLADYEAMARHFARDARALDGVRVKLARNRESFPLFDTARFTRHLETAFAKMRARQRRHEAPSDFAVAPETGDAP